MADESSDANLEWKKKGFEEKEILTRKTNVKKALQYEATEKKPVSPVFTAQPVDLPKGLKKIRKKIKEVYDDDEDEDDYLLTEFPLSADNSLLKALHEDEKRQLKQQETINTSKMLQNAGKMEALMAADRTSKSLGLKGLKAETINANMQDVTLNSQTYDKALKEDISKRLKLRGRQMSEGETINLLRGIKRIQDMATVAEESRFRAIEGLKIDEIVNAGKKSTDDEQVAEIILKKSGRKSKKDAKEVAARSKTRLQSKTSAANKEMYQNKELYRS